MWGQVGCCKTVSCDVHRIVVCVIALLASSSCVRRNPAADQLGDQIDESAAELTGSTCSAFSSNGLSGGNVKLTNISGSLSNSYPVSMQQANAPTPFWIMGELTGRISRIPITDKPSESAREVLLDLSPQVYLDNEAGFFSFALDPQFSSTRSLFASYTINSNATGILHVIDKFVADTSFHFTAPAQRILAIPVANNFHIGGNIAFGTDGMLLVGTGFSGTDASPDGFAEDLRGLHGKILRLDVLSASARQNPNGYISPQDNPYVSSGGGLPEIFAYGFRNPWRFSVDSATGLIWAGDVGAALREEIDIVRGGNNYGWPTREGNICNANSTSSAPPCTVPHQTEPIFTYNHTQGSCVTGGYVYRGSALQGLAGQYIFGDCTAGKVWSVNATTSGGNLSPSLLVTAPSGITSFAQDANGELYILGRDSQVYRLDPASQAQEGVLPALLSKSGCGLPTSPFDPPEKVFQYQVNVPFWSDGAQKERYVSLPQGATLAVNGNGHIDAPPNTVYIKRFSRNNLEVETRLFMRLMDGSWAGFSYAWDSNAKDGVLVPAAGQVSTLSDGTSWRYPSRTECLACHGGVAGDTLGTQVGQFNLDVARSSGKTVNQLVAMSTIGILKGLPSSDPSTLDKFISPADTSQPLDLRARTYLHVNCSFCHQPGGNGLGVQDFRLSKSGLAGLNVCGIAPSYGTFGLSNAALFAAGSPNQSVIPVRMLKVDASRMPTISSDIVDQDGVAMMQQWIATTVTCPNLP